MSCIIKIAIEQHHSFLFKVSFNNWLCIEPATKPGSLAGPCWKDLFFSLNQRAMQCVWAQCRPINPHHLPLAGSLWDCGQFGLTREIWIGRLFLAMIKLQVCCFRVSFEKHATCMDLFTDVQKAIKTGINTNKHTDKQAQKSLKVWECDMQHAY